MIPLGLMKRLKVNVVAHFPSPSFQERDCETAAGSRGARLCDRHLRGQDRDSNSKRDDGEGGGE